jgi:CubicO group peptidase (beta-lactamase class C family)
MREDGKRLRRLALAAALLLVPIAQTQAACGVPTALNDGWNITTPESTGLDGERLCAIAARLKETEANVHAVVIARHGRLVFEQYFAGYDEPWGATAGRRDFDATSKHDMRSVSKSVTSLLTGIAIDRGLIAGADAPVVQFFPEYASVKSPGWDQIAVQHLLTMSSGLQWDENRAWTDPKNDEPHLANETDPLRYVLAKPIATPPDAVWNYNGGGVDLLGGIIEHVAGKPFVEFAREALFEPLGITDWEWKAYENGKVGAAAGLRLRPRDAMKIGQLMLNKGAWYGKQIVPAAWIEQSITPRFQAIGYFGGLFFYGRLWWMGRTLAGDKEVKWVAAMGLGGQRIFIVPERDLVVMTTSGLYGSGRQGHAAIDILANYVIPFVRD